MVYATAADLIEAYGLGSVIEAVTHPCEPLDLALFSDAVAGCPLDAYSASQREAVGETLSRVRQALLHQSREMDHRLDGRVALLVNDKRLECCTALAFAELAKHWSPVFSREESAHWHRWLEDQVRCSTQLPDAAAA